MEKNPPNSPITPINNSAKNTYSLKFLTLGEMLVGKTSIIKKFVDNSFYQGQTNTIGIDTSTITTEYNNDILKLSFFDTSGQERFHSIAKQFFNKANGVILVYDITKAESFNKVSYWIETIKERVNMSNIGIVILGNKNDLESKREIPMKEGKDLCNGLGIPFFETSAKNGSNVKEAMICLCDECFKKNKKEDLQIERNHQMHIQIQLDEDGGKGCCF